MWGTRELLRVSLPQLHRETRNSRNSRRERWAHAAGPASHPCSGVTPTPPHMGVPWPSVHLHDGARTPSHRGSAFGNEILQLGYRLELSSRSECVHRAGDVITSRVCKGFVGSNLGLANTPLSPQVVPSFLLQRGPWGSPAPSSLATSQTHLLHLVVGALTRKCLKAASERPSRRSPRQARAPVAPNRNVLLPTPPALPLS